MNACLFVFVFLFGCWFEEASLLEKEANSMDCVLEVCGNSNAVPTGVKCLKPGGAYMFVGMVHPDTSLRQITGEHIVRKCLTVRGIHNYQGYHLRRAVDFLAANLHKYPFEALIAEHTYGLQQLPEAIERAIRKDDFRVCIQFIK